MVRYINMLTAFVALRSMRVYLPSRATRKKRRGTAD
jgi:hypothetical protein